MRKRRILSLLLAVAVTVTMLVAVPLTASAAEPVSGPILWEMGNWGNGQTMPTESGSIEKDNLKLYGRTSSSTTSIEYDSTDSRTFTIDDAQGTTKQLTGYIKLGGQSNFQMKNGSPILHGVFEFTPAVDGSVELYVKSTSSSGSRSVYVNQQEPTGEDRDSTNAIGEISVTNDNSVKYKSISGIKGGQKVYIFTSGDFRFYGIGFTPSGPVEEKAATSVTISGDQEVYVGSTIKLTAKMDPDGATDTIKWSTEDNDKVELDEASGQVKGVEVGTATIKAQAYSRDGDIRQDVYGTYEIQVKAKPELPSTTGTTADLEAATKTTVYDFIQAINDVKRPIEDYDVPYQNGHLYFDGKVYAGGKESTGDNPHPAGVYVKTGKNGKNLDGTDESNVMGIDNDNSYFALKLKKGQTIYVGFVGSGGSTRFGLIAESPTGNKNTGGVGKDNMSDGILAFCNTTDSKTLHVINYTAQKEEEIVYITSMHDSTVDSTKTGNEMLITQIRVTVPPEKGIFDSGSYGETFEKGIIRFLQSFDEADIKEIGFYIVDSEGAIVDASTEKLSTSELGKISQMAEAKGFYADIYDIDKTGHETDKYYAIPFVTLTDGTIIKAETITGEVNWDNQLTGGYNEVPIQ